MLNVYEPYIHTYEERKINSLYLIEIRIEWQTGEWVELIRGTSYWSDNSCLSSTRSTFFKDINKNNEQKVEIV